jgi:hypothetical protein
VNCSTIEFPSEIQRAEDCVGIAMPMVPLSWAKDGAPTIDAAVASAKSALLESFMVSSLAVMRHGTLRSFPRNMARGAVRAQLQAAGISVKE